MRRTFRDFRLSRAPMVLGECQSNIPALLSYVNEATQRLINAGSETGWWGAWSKVAFNVTRLAPYVTLGRLFARAINMDVCRFPIRIQNEFYEELDAGIGLRIPGSITDWCGALEGFDRGVVSTMIDLTPTNQLVRLYASDAADVGKSVIFSGATDQNGNAIYSQNGNVSINGFALQLVEPPGFVTSSSIVTGWAQIEKDETVGDVTLAQVDASSGVEVTLSRYAADETNPAYRRYYINSLPCSCCPNPNTPNMPGNVVVTAMCKYEFLPVYRDSDPLIIGNVPALIEECQAIKYSSMDSANAAAQEAKHHRKAINLLNQELAHYLGTDLPATNFAPFGTATLARQGIGLVI